MVSNNRSSFIQSLQYETLAYTLFSKVLTQLIISKNTLALTSFQKVKQTYSLPSNVITTNNIDNTVSEVLSYIESHLNQSLTLEQIAKKFSMSISNLQRKFKLTLKLTVNNYIRYRRLEIAKYHLEQGIKGVTEVAYEAGYNHPANFTNAFKKKFGHPPTTFVKNNNSHTVHVNTYKLWITEGLDPYAKPLFEKQRTLDRDFSSSGVFNIPSTTVYSLPSEKPPITWVRVHACKPE